MAIGAFLRGGYVRYVSNTAIEPPDILSQAFSKFVSAMDDLYLHASRSSQVTGLVFVSIPNLSCECPLKSTTTDKYSQSKAPHAAAIAQQAGLIIRPCSPEAMTAMTAGREVVCRDRLP